MALTGDVSAARAGRPKGRVIGPWSPVRARRRRLVKAVLCPFTAVSLLASAVPVLTSVKPASASSLDGVRTFGAGGSYDWRVPAGVIQLVVDVQGAQGYAGNSPSAAGRGGRVTGALPVTPGEVLRIRVGGVPTGTVWTAELRGGFNGGGVGNRGAGGGASDIYRGNVPLVVAGGGGGGNYQGNEGDGGGLVAANGYGPGPYFSGGPGYGGSQSAGGIGGYGRSSYAGGDGDPGKPGVAGQGGAGGHGIYGGPGGGGGGGYFGGGGGGGSDSFFGGTGGGGGGGSSFTHPSVGNVRHDRGWRSGAGSVTVRWFGSLLGLSSTFGWAGDPVNTATGNFHDTSTDVAIPWVYGLRFQRTYNSLATIDPGQAAGAPPLALGPGWSSTVDEYLGEVEGGLFYRAADGAGHFFASATPTEWTTPLTLSAKVVPVADGREMRFVGGEVHSFDAIGRLRWMDDGAGQRVVITRASGSVSMRSFQGDMPGPEIQLTDEVLADGSPGQDGLFDRVWTPGGTTIGYAYSGGRLVRVDWPPPSGQASSGESFTYVDGRLDTVTTDVGTGRPPMIRVDNAYDGLGRVQSQVLPGGDSLVFEYLDPQPTEPTIRTRVTHGAGATAEALTYVHDPLGRLIAVADPRQQQQSRSWERDRPDTTVTRRGAVSNIDYDVTDRVERQVLPDPVTPGTAAQDRELTYCNASTGDPRVRTAVDAAGIITETRFSTPEDPANPCGAGLTVPSEVTTAAGTPASSTRRLESTSGLITTMTDADGVRTELRWDPARRLLLSTTTDPDATVPGALTTYFAYDAAGRQRVQRTPEGIETWSEHDTAGRLTATVGPVRVPGRTCDARTCDFPTAPPTGPTERYEHWADGSLRTRVDQAGKRWEHRTDLVAGGGWTTTDTEPDGDERKATYDAAGHLLSETVGDPDAPAELATTTYDYGTLGRLQRVTTPEGVQTHYRYDDDGNRTAEVRGPNPTDPAHTTTSIYDLRGRLTEVLGPVGDTDANGTPTRSHLRYGYDGADRMTVKVDGDGAAAARTWYRYDPAGRLRFAIIDVDADDAPSDPASPDPTLRDPGDDVTEYRYTAAGRLNAEIRPPQGAAHFDWVDGDQTAKLTTRYEYDDAGRVDAIIDPAGLRRETLLDGDGRTTGTKLAGSYVRHNLDAAGRVVDTFTPSPTGAGEAVESWRYDDRGLLTSHAEPHAPTLTSPPTSTYTYQPDGRLATVRHPNQALIGDRAEARYVWDGRGNRRKRIQWTNNDPTSTGTYVQVTEEWRYDRDDRLIATITPSSATTSTTYDTYGRPDTTTFPSGRAETTTWWNSGPQRRQTSTQPGHPTIVTESFYDGRSRLTRSTGPDDQVNLTWSAVHGPNQENVVPTTGDPLSTSYRYDLAGRTTRTTHPGGASTDHVYDRLGRIATISLTEPGGTPAPIATYTWDDDGHLTNESLGATGSAGNRTWVYPTNHADRPASYRQLLAGAQTTVPLTWTHSGRLATETSAAGTTTYGYDPAGQLTSATGAGRSDAWTYNSRGSALTSTLTGTATNYHWYDTDGRRTTTTDGGRIINYGYDPDGKRTSATESNVLLPTNRTWTYDSRGQLTRTTTTTAYLLTTTTGRRYDSQGRLSSTTDTNATGPLIWDQQGDAVTSGSATTPTLHIHGPAGLVATRTPGAQPAYHSRDAHRSVLSGGTTTYTPYGQPQGLTPPTSLFGYRSELTVAGEVHLRARTYDPNTALFLTTDPLDGVDGTPTLGNPYHYTDNDPVNSSDPTGLRPTDNNLWPTIDPSNMPELGPTIGFDMPGLGGSKGNGKPLCFTSPFGTFATIQCMGVQAPPRPAPAPPDPSPPPPGPPGGDGAAILKLIALLLALGITGALIGTILALLLMPGTGDAGGAGTSTSTGKCSAQQTGVGAEALAGLAHSIYSQGPVPEQTVGVLRVCRVVDGAILYYSAGQPDLTSRQIDRAQVFGIRPVIRAGAHAEEAAIDQARSDARLAGGFVPIDIYATNKVCPACSIAVEDSGGIIVDGPRGGRYGRWFGTVWS